MYFWITLTHVWASAVEKVVTKLEVKLALWMNYKVWMPIGLILGRRTIAWVTENIHVVYCKNAHRKYRYIPRHWVYYVSKYEKYVLWPSDATCWHRSGSTKVMHCCLIAPNVSSSVEKYTSVSRKCIGRWKFNWFINQLVASSPMFSFSPIISTILYSGAIMHGQFSPKYPRCTPSTSVLSLI